MGGHARTHYLVTMAESGKIAKRKALTTKNSAHDDDGLYHPRMSLKMSFLTATTKASHSEQPPSLDRGL